MTLIIAGGETDTMVDPALAAMRNTVVMWAKAVYNGWLPGGFLRRMMQQARGMMATNGIHWQSATVPALASVYSAARCGWRFVDYRTVITDTGDEFKLDVDSPAIVNKLGNEAVRQWRWRRVARLWPEMGGDAGEPGAIMQPIWRLFDPRTKLDGWGADERGALRSVLTNRQWSQARCNMAKFVDHDRCLLCLSDVGCCIADDGTLVGDWSRVPRGTADHRMVCTRHRHLHDEASDREIDLFVDENLGGRSIFHPLHS